MNRLIIKSVVKTLLRCLFLFPVDDNKIFFSSYKGRQYSCNPKYLYEFLLSRPEKNNYKYVWEFEDVRKKRFVPDARVVKSFSFRSVFQSMTSKFIVVNTDFPWWIPLRKNQVLLQTWHGGGAYKKVGLDAGWSEETKENQKRNSVQVTYYISSSKQFTSIQSLAKFVPEKKFINTGMPRNSIFFTEQNYIVKKVYSDLKIPNELKIALYAPTYRNEPSFKRKESSGSIDLDFNNVKKSLEKRFGGKWLIVFRGHYYDAYLYNELKEFVLDATSYEDMQELLYSASVLITDYSSTIWDFALSNKPIFLLAMDFSKYGSDRGFYTPPSKWPASISTTNEELCDNIEHFDLEHHVQLCEQHRSDFGSFENVNASFLVWKELGVVES